MIKREQAVVTTNILNFLNVMGGNYGILRSSLNELVGRTKKKGKKCFKLTSKSLSSNMKTPLNRI